MRFGEILSKIEKKMVSSYVDELFQKEMKDFKKHVLENKKISSAFHIYNQLNTKQGLDKDLATLYVHESVRQLEKNLEKTNLADIKKWLKGTVSENHYEDVDNLLYTKSDTILESVSSRKKIINNLMEKKQVSETINLPLESIFRIAENQLKNYIEKLDEVSQKDLLKVLMTEDTELSKEFTDLKSKTLESLSKITSVEDDVTKNKLTETIELIEKEEYSKVNYVRLYSLYNNIQ